MAQQHLHDADGQLALGQPAPPFDLPGTDGKTYSLEDFRGKARALAVIFSCNHCPYAIMSEDRMIALGKEYRDKGVQFILICSNDEVTYPQDSFENMKKRARGKGYPFPYLRDEPQTLAHAYGAKVTPHVFLFDSDLKLCYRGAIDDNINNPNAVKRHYLRDAIEALLAGKPGEIETDRTRAVGCSIKWK